MPPSKTATQNSSMTRTVVEDLARLITENKIGADELSRIDKNLLAEAESYAATLDLGFFDLESMRKGTDSIPRTQTSLDLNSALKDKVEKPFTTKMDTSANDVPSSNQVKAPVVDMQSSMTHSSNIDDHLSHLFSKKKDDAPLQSYTENLTSESSHGTTADQGTDAGTSLHAAYTAARFSPFSQPGATPKVNPLKTTFQSPLKVPVFKKGFQDKPQTQASAQNQPYGFHSDLASEPEVSATSKLQEELDQELGNITMPSTTAVSGIVGSVEMPKVKKTIVGFPPEPEPVVIKKLTEQELLEQQLEKLRRNIENVGVEEKAAYENVQESEAKLTESAQYFTVIIEKEKILEQRQQEIKAKEETATSLKERKMIEEERWTVEDERQKLEEGRWEKDQEKKAIEKEIAEKKAAAALLTSKKQEVSKEFEKVKVKLEAMKAHKDLDIYKAKLQETETAKKKGEVEWQKQNAAEIKAKDDLETGVKKRKALDQQIASIEQDEKKAASEETRHIYEEKRWKVEQELRETEKSSWNLEESIEAMDSAKQTLMNKFADLQLEEEQLKAKINELEEAIKKALTL